MNPYKALKSADAEIILDLEKGKAFFDYSKNRFGRKFNSNYCVLSKTGEYDKNIFDEIKSLLYFYLMLFGSPLMVFFPEHQYKWQKLLKKMCLDIRGMQIQTSIGELKDNKLIFNIDNNIWFDYELEGEYKEHIKNICLLRHFIIKIKNGITFHKQSGWDVIFEFKEIPKNGNCVLRSTL